MRWFRRSRDSSLSTDDPFGNRLRSSPSDDANGYFAAVNAVATACPS